MNLQAMIARTRGMIANPDATLAEHANPVPPIGVVMREHLLPLLVLTELASLIIAALLIPEAGIFTDPVSTVVALVAGIGLGVFSVWIIALIVRYHAARLGGRNDPRAAFVLTALAMSPLFVAGTAAQFLAFASFELALLLLLAGVAYAFVLIYRGSGFVLGVPDNARGRHIAAVILTQMVVSFVLFTLIATLFMPPLPA